MSKFIPAVFITALILGGCISSDNPVIQAGDGTPDVDQCALLDGVLDGKDYVPRAAAALEPGGPLQPDIFFLGWSKLDARNDLRFPARGYDSEGFEDKLFVSRRLAAGEFTTWQLLPRLDETCQDVEKIRIHSFDVAPDGNTLYISMRREEDSHLAVYEFDFSAYNDPVPEGSTLPPGLKKKTQGDSVDFLNPTYVGDDAVTGNHMLFVSKSVTGSEIPLNYGGPEDGLLLDEYDRAPTPLIHILDAETGDVRRIGYNNSHQLEPISVTRPDGTRLVVFTQWEHQQSTNRFSLWKIQVDGSDNFTFYGQESATDRSAANVFQAREVKSGPYQGYILMTQGREGFIADGSVAMTYRENLDLRSNRIFLERFQDGLDISRNPEHYNEQSFVFAYRETLNNAYGIYLKDYPPSPEDDVTSADPLLVMSHPDMHFVHPRSYYPPEDFVATLDEGTLGESRSSYTNMALAGNAGFLVQNLTESDNGVQHQLDGIAPSDISLQFFIPSQTFGGEQRSEAVGKLGWSGSPELSVPASGFIAPEADGSLGVVVKPGLYVWKVHKRFDHNGSDIWIPIRAERQEISFVSDRVNACNQCHQERSQFNLDLYEDVTTVASTKMQSTDLSAVPDISGYPTYDAVPDFHTDITPLLSACSGCHDARDKLDLSNETGWRAENATWLNLVRGGHKLEGTEEVLPYVYNSINPTGFDNDYHPAPFLWALMLGDDLSVSPEPGFPDDSSRALVRPGDYGATYDARIETAIADINAQEDHTGIWTPAELQAFITYSTTQSMVGLSDRITFESSSLSTDDAAAQKAYQAMVAQCFDCHNDHTSGGVDDPAFGLPLEKRFRSGTDLKRSHLRFVVDSHKAEKDDDAYSQYVWQSDINSAMRNTLRSALDRINFDPTMTDESQLLVYARCDGLHTNVVHSHCLVDTNPDYLAIANWVKGVAGVNNNPPTIDSTIPEITIWEYEEPGEVGPISWTDTDTNSSGEELSQLFLNKSATSEHTFNDTMLSLNYLSFKEAMLTTYAILGDRGPAETDYEREFEFVVSDGQNNSEIQTVSVKVKSDYEVPSPSSEMPEFTAFYTVRENGALCRIGGDTAVANDVCYQADHAFVGTIDGYSPEFTTVYRRSDRGWLYFVNQAEQRIYVVDETNAEVKFTIALDHEPNRETDEHMQTVYLVWWRPAEYVDNVLVREGELQGLLESRQGNSNGDFYVSLGDGGVGDTDGAPPADGSELVVVPEWRTRMIEADNAVSVYVWRRATFMTQLVGDGIDKLNVLNLVTGKARNLGDFSFEAKTHDGNDYEARDYYNVRAVLLGEDGSFYGFNQDLDSPPVLFNFDPLARVQVEVPLDDDLSDLMSNPIQYGTPFVVVPPRP